MMQPLRNKNGNVLILVLSIILFMTLIASAVFAMFIVSMSMRANRINRFERQIEVENIAYTIFNQFDQYLEFDQWTALDAYSNIEILVTEEAESWIILIREEEFDMFWEAEIQYNPVTTIYHIIRFGQTNELD